MWKVIDLGDLIITSPTTGETVRICQTDALSLVLDVLEASVSTAMPERWMTRGDVHVTVQKGPSLKEATDLFW